MPVQFTCWAGIMKQRGCELHETKKEYLETDPFKLATVSVLIAATYLSDYILLCTYEWSAAGFQKI